MTYTAPVKDIQFVLNELADLEGIQQLPGFEDATPDLVDAVLQEAARFAEEVLAPLNRTGDTTGVRLQDGKVVTPEGWKEAYQGFVEGGWNSVAFSDEYDGQNLPYLVATAVQEMWHAANMAFGLCPLLTQGAVEALELHGCDDLKTRYLRKMVSGEWTGTMNLTEPQAGSDLSAVRTRAEPDGAHYRLYGQKIFITYGDHELTENIIHMVLARTPDAPEGVKGISLFLVPKFLPDQDGAPGERNDVHCVSLEHKLGIHGSPTAVLAYGDNGGAVGYLVGEENNGLMYMFTMMNLARHAVGVEGYAIAERAYQQARAFARERVQGRPIGVKSGDRVSIIHHPDVQRMLMTMKSQIEAMRGLAFVWSSALDKSGHHPDPEERARQQQIVEILTPVVKGWCTEVGNDIAYLGVQIHGGMGFIEETGAAQYLRDARITTIYEGTTGIQAADLTGRKLQRDQGRAVTMVIDLMQETAAGIQAVDQTIAEHFEHGLADLRRATRWMLESGSEDPRLPAAASGYYLTLWGVVAGGWIMSRSAVRAKAKLDAGEDDDFYRSKITTARYYATHTLPQSGALAATITEGSAHTITLDPNQY